MPEREGPSPEAEHDGTGQPEGEASAAGPGARRHRITRRRVLTGGLLVAGGLIVGAAGGAIGYQWPHPSTSSGTASSGANQIDTFFSRPDLTPPQIAISVPGGQHFPSGRPNQVVLAPRGYGNGAPGQQGLMIRGRDGLQWFRPTQQFPMDCKVQTYQGRPVITWWEGQIIDGYGQGAGQIIDTAYQPVATVTGGNGLQADLHEFLLTPDGTALVTAYRTVETDLRAVGGPEKAQLLEGVALEVDVATGHVLFEWHSLDHVPLTETYAASPGTSPTVPFDYFHINSIDLAADGDLLLSSRNTWTVYKVSRSTGAIVWRLHGKHSDFTLAAGSEFSWQHDARAHGTDLISLFDNAASPAEADQSRGLVLHLDLQDMRVTLQKQFTHPTELLVPNQGNLQLQPGGGAFVGWGAQPYFSLFGSDGSLLFGGRMPNDVQSYRTFLQSWTGVPTDQPAVVVRSSEVGGSTVYVSWNGATEVAAWVVFAGNDENSLKSAGRAARSGFETTISVNPTGPHFMVVALNRDGQELGRSQLVSVTH